MILEERKLLNDVEEKEKKTVKRYSITMISRQAMNLSEKDR